jgi:hypothetical protein
MGVHKLKSVTDFFKFVREVRKLKGVTNSVEVLTQDSGSEGRNIRTGTRRNWSNGQVRG